MAVDLGQIGEVANLAQLTGLDSIKLIALIVKAASNARMHKKNCKHFAQHLKLIGNLLEQLKLSDLKEWPETREPLEELEEALKRAFLLVNSCQEKSYLYLLALGWNTVYQFKKCQADIDRLLRLIPLITLVDNNRERLRAIVKDKRDYTLDKEELEIHETILKPEITEKDARVLEKSLSRSYPGLTFDEVLDKENRKLKMELQRMEECLELDQCEVIHHLIDVTESTIPQKMRGKNCKSGSYEARIVKNQRTEQEKNFHQDASDVNAFAELREDMESTSLEQDLDRDSMNLETWRNSLYDCCMDPYLCISTSLYPCGTFSNIAAMASDGKVSQENACNDFMTYSLVLGCFCYTCWYRRKLRKRFKIPGGCCDDFWTHALCFCCALVQEWREITTRSKESAPTGKMNPPSIQTMDKE